MPITQAVSVRVGGLNSPNMAPPSLKLCRGSQRPLDLPHFFCDKLVEYLQKLTKLHLVAH
ncbi:CIC11C00000005033 [Sungouiella intermedia]|uniref:CIC11C00000005033 n=1 Tax=Sungouiella intermedia TaxID=45354 RepID=A0A1L0BEU8_9ASCO|nr:CIC11C00000005033 [[Candida] intermedia]